MKLLNAHVRNFRCIRDSEPFDIDPKVTCLVGKNESGKTALLTALAKNKPVVSSTIGPLTERDLPRHLKSKLKARLV